MSATNSHPPLRAVPFKAPTARLALRSKGPSAGHAELDGAWWPRSRDLPSELSALADVLDPLWGRITRIAVNPRHWPILPPRIFVSGHVVKVGWFTSELDPHGIVLLSCTAGRWDLLVVPPETGASSAARLMAAASAGTGPPMTATGLMTAEQARDGSREGREGRGRADGGALWKAPGLEDYGTRDDGPGPVGIPAYEKSWS
ncbi:DUF5994 family protein [Streptomyces cupreus]|uniref:Uncharacterized protein n=1 Tax=Streptomyces cupreus TaxID=2759956 RepID=A0A7X1J6Z5_9ACTN|nr:DUF5994 family protein [Streptomyces cupreus]MBC2905358.1 hypothetical protein [Streptomyces cupreus]